ncbi:MAG: TlpA family protein disulfide reductase [Gemmatimonadota bacterium]
MSSGRRSGEWILNGLTVVALAAAFGLVVRDRVVPALRETRIVDPGERIPTGIQLRDLTTGDTVALESLAPATILVFLTTCPACERSTPAWREAVERAPGSRLIAVSVGNDPDADAWTARELPGTTTFQPLDTARFLSVLRIPVVPAAFSIGNDGRMLDRREGVLGPDDAWTLLTAPLDRGTAAGR